MSVEELVPFCSGRIGVDVAAFLTAIALVDDSDPLSVAELRPSPLAIAAMHAKRSCGINVARTYRGSPAPQAIRLDCPPGNVLFTLALVGADAHVVVGRKSVIDGTMPAGTACVAEPGELLEIRSRTACDFVHLAVPARLLVRPDGGRREFSGLVVHDALIGRIGRLLGEAPAAWLRAYAELLSQLAVIRVLQLSRDPAHSCLAPWRLKKVQNLVEANIAGRLRLSDLAAASGLSRMHFAAQFRAATGLRPHAYVLMRRVEHAKRSMAEGNGTLVGVALDSGFQSQSQFCTIFKRLTGMTPSAWRQQFSQPSTPSGRHPERPIGPARAHLSDLHARPVVGSPIPRQTRDRVAWSAMLLDATSTTNGTATVRA